MIERRGEDCQGRHVSGCSDQLPIAKLRRSQPPRAKLRRSRGEEKVARRETSGSKRVSDCALKARKDLLSALPARGGLGRDRSRGFTSGYHLGAPPARVQCAQRRTTFSTPHAGSVPSVALRHHI